MINLKDRLSHLNYREACKLLGPEGERLIRQGGKNDFDITEQVTWGDDFFRLNLGEATVTLSLTPEKPKYLRFACSECSEVCEHVGAAFSLILEEKLSLGLSAPPPERRPVESLSDEEIVKLAVEERAERAKTEKMQLKSMNREELWTDYAITSHSSGKSYRVALRGWKKGDSYCSCPDFRKNTLGTCKHLLYTIQEVKRRFSKAVRERPYQVKNIAVHLRYGEEPELRILVPDSLDPRTMALLRPLMNRPIKNIKDLLHRIKEVERLDHEVTIYPDAEEFINRVLYLERIRDKVAEIRKDPKNHPLRKGLLKTELLPYQLDGIAFSVGVGRAVLADDMGLGKTIQGIGVAEMLSQEAGISKVLVVCPASVKSQWRLEMMRFSNRSHQIVLGSARERAAQYDNPCFFTICNYEQVLRDLLPIERVKWDLIILDEGQRIKNWAAKTSQVIKALKSPFALVLSGTPLENRLDELFSIVEFIDDQRLGPAFRFYNRYRVVDEKGKVLGYKNLDDLRERLKPILLRRTRKSVMSELPPRVTEIRRIPPTDEQLNLHNGQMKIVKTIISKRYISEMDLLRLQKALLICRMAANSTFLVDKVPPGYSSKLVEFENLIDQLIDEEDRKIVLFSEWTTMLGLIEPLLEKRKLNHVRLDGSIPQKKRQGLIHEFQKDPDCKLFITTNAGATGLNLQAANTVINVDLPWNPAILEQRISRVHRMGQKRPVQAFLLVTEETLEEKLLGTLSAKHELALAALDPDSKVKTVDLASGMEELKRRLEILLGAKPDAALDESQRAEVDREAERLALRERVASAGGQLLGAAFAFIGEMLPKREGTEETLQMTESLKSRLSECLEKGQDGRLRMTITLPDESIVNNLAKSLAQILGGGWK
ncbi:MAG TPA: DEAD/DEAH box helicase [Thermodesulfobacteriota bacterium]|nr:DEAD/DEAH box helicase [Thermodesulfobacteriota bacterium]